MTRRQSVFERRDRRKVKKEEEGTDEERLKGAAATSSSLMTRDSIMVLRLIGNEAFFNWHYGKTERNGTYITRWFNLVQANHQHDLLVIRLKIFSEIGCHWRFFKIVVVLLVKNFLSLTQQQQQILCIPYWLELLTKKVDWRGRDELNGKDRLQHAINLMFPSRKTTRMELIHSLYTKIPFPGHHTVWSWSQTVCCDGQTTLVVSLSFY